jgi:hypothetical protein
MNSIGSIIVGFPDKAMLLSAHIASMQPLRISFVIFLSFRIAEAFLPVMALNFVVLSRMRTS